MSKIIKFIIEVFGPACPDCGSHRTRKVSNRTYHCDNCGYTWAE